MKHFELPHCRTADVGSRFAMTLLSILGTHREEQLTSVLDRVTSVRTVLMRCWLPGMPGEYDMEQNGSLLKSSKRYINVPCAKYTQFWLFQQNRDGFLKYREDPSSVLCAATLGCLYGIYLEARKVTDGSLDCTHPEQGNVTSGFDIYRWRPSGLKIQINVNSSLYPRKYIFSLIKILLILRNTFKWLFQFQNVKY